MADDAPGGLPPRAGRGFGLRSGTRSQGLIQPGAIPRGPTRSGRARSRWVVLGNAVISVLVLAALALGVGAYVGHDRIEAPGPLAQEATVVIPRGSGTGEVADLLERAGVIDSQLLFQSAARLTRASDDLKAGEYVFKPGVPMREVIDALVEGRVVQHAVTIPEGWTGQMIADRLDADPVLAGPPVGPPAEGSLLPDTYRFERGTSREQMLARMQAEQRRVLDTVWSHRDTLLPLRSPADLVTLASVVEKETGRADERPRVAAVFLNRLRQGMRLQSDPTVIYGMVGGRGRLDRPLARADLEAQTPYNTYTRPGLPDGPIANPGRASLEAVANPSQTADLYFVADGTGGHAFAATLDEHNRNVARWRSLQAAAAPKADPNAAPGSPPGSLPGSPSGPDVAGGLPEAGGAVPADKPRAFADPVANTRLDPLLDRTYDLNSPQTVPKVGALVTTPDQTAAQPRAGMPDLTLQNDDGPAAKPAAKPAQNATLTPASVAGKATGKPTSKPTSKPTGKPDGKPARRRPKHPPATQAPPAIRPSVPAD